jgi:hypothetical protein
MPLIVTGSEGQTIYGTGSIVTENKQGDQQTEITGSVIVSGSLLVTGSLYVSGNTIYNYGNLYNMPTSYASGDVSGSGTGRFVEGIYTAGPLNVSGALNFANVSTLPASNGGLAAVGGTLAVSGSAIADGTVAVASDEIVFLDADGSLKRETIADFTSGIAGTGLTATSGQLILHFAEVGSVALASTDSVMVLDNNSATKRSTVTQLGTYLCGNNGGLAHTAGVLTISGSNLADGTADFDNDQIMFIDSDGTPKRETIADLFSAISGDTAKYNIISGSNPGGLVLSGSGITIGGHENGIAPPYTTVKGGMAVTNMLTHLGDLSGSGKIFNVGGIQTQGTVGVTGSILIRGGSIILGTMSGSGKFINVGGIETQGNLGVTGSATIRNSLLAGKMMAGGPNIQFTGSTEFTGSVRVPHADTTILNALHGAGTPTTGQIYYNISTNKLNFYNGSGWSVVSVD